MDPLCDSHVHVFGPTSRFPLVPSAELPAHGSLADYLGDVRPLGVSRSVFVQPSLYGLDNECQLQAAEALGGAGRAIVALADPPDHASRTALHRRGARGVRLSHGLRTAVDAGATTAMARRIEAFDAALAGTGWCIEVLAPAWMTEGLLPVLARVGTPVVLCHIGMFRAADGPAQDGFRRLLHVMEGGQVWTKLTGVLRWSSSQGFDDTLPMVAALAQTAPDRLIWGSDYPHIGATRDIATLELLGLFRRWFPHAAIQRRVLVDNPAALFSFAE